MRLKDVLSERSLNELFAEAEGDKSRLLGPDGQPIEKPRLLGPTGEPITAAKPEEPPKAPEIRQRHTKLAGKLGQEVDLGSGKKVTTQKEFLDHGYKLFTKENMSEMTLPPYPHSASTDPCKRNVVNGRYFSYGGQRYYVIGIFSHQSEGRVRGEFQNKVLIKAEDGEHYISGETIAMKWVKAANPSYQKITEYLAGIAKIKMTMEEEEEMNSERSRSFISLMHQLDQADAKVASMGDDEIEEDMVDEHMFDEETMHEECECCGGDGCPECMPGHSHEVPCDCCEGTGQIGNMVCHECLGTKMVEAWEPNEMGDGIPGSGLDKEGAYASRKAVAKGEDLPQGWALAESRIDEKKGSGKWAGMSLSELESKAKKIRDKEKRSPKESKDLKSLNFKIMLMKKSKKTTKKEVDEAMEPNDMGRWTKNDGIYQSRKAVVHGHNVAENMVESDEGPQLGHWDENEGTYMPRKPVKPGHKVAEADQNPQLGHWDEDSLGAYKPKTAVKHGHKVAEDTVSEGDAGVYGKTGGGDPARHPNESLKALKSNRMNESKQELNSALNELRKNAGLPSI